jgi:hypothetical protein
MRSQSVSCGESIFNLKSPNLKQHSGVIDDSQSVFKIDYAPHLNRWFSRRTASRDGGTGRELILVNVYDFQNKSTYEWCRPDLQAIVEGENLPMIDQLLKEDVLNYLQSDLNMKKNQNHSMGKERNMEQGQAAAPRNAALSCA